MTSNTIQFGARLQLTYGVQRLQRVGLPQPRRADSRRFTFHFIADIAGDARGARPAAHVLFSIQLELTLEGPLPWHAQGTGSFEIGFIFTITINVQLRRHGRRSRCRPAAGADRRAGRNGRCARRPRQLAAAAAARARIQSVTLRALPDPAEHACSASVRLRSRSRRRSCRSTSRSSASARPRPTAAAFRHRRRASSAGNGDRRCADAARSSRRRSSSR